MTVLKIRSRKPFYFLLVAALGSILAISASSNALAKEELDDIKILEKTGKADNTWIFFTADHGLGVGLGVYTAILLSAFSARPFWNTSILGPLFLLMAAGLLGLMGVGYRRRRVA